LRQAEIEAAQQRADRAGHAPPTLERALGEAPVDEHQRNAALGAGDDQVRPEIRLDEQREIWLPMIEEAVDEARRVKNHELVDRPLGQALLGEIGRRDGARGAQHGESFFADALDQRDHREQLADAGAVHPHQRAQRTREGAFAVPFVKTRGELLAAFQSMRQERRRKRRRRCHQQPIGVERERQALTHDGAAPAAHQQAHRLGRSPH
jgi:hypothetical protein